MKLFGPDLRAHGHQKNYGKNPGPHQVTKIHRHRDQIPARFSKRGRGNLDDPEQQGDFGNLAANSRLVVVGFVGPQGNHLLIAILRKGRAETLG